MDKWELENQQIRQAIIEQLNLKPEQVTVTDSMMTNIKITIKDLTQMTDDKLNQLEKVIQTVNPHYEIVKWEIIQQHLKPYFDLTLWC